MESLLIDFNNEKDRARLWRVLKRLRGKHRVEVAQYRPRRSDRQNRFYWPCFVQPFADFLKDQGEAVSELDAHEILKSRYLRKAISDPKTGEVMEWTRSTTELSTGEFNEYLDKCAAWLADMFGFIMPNPSDYYERDTPAKAAARD